MADSALHSKRDLIHKAKSSQLVVVIVASVIISASIIGIKILWAQRSYQAKIIDAKSAASDELEKNIAAVTKLEEEFRKFEASPVNSSLVLDALPSKYDFPALATSVEKIAALSNVELVSFVGDDLTATALNSQGQPAPTEMPFSLSIKGTYENMKLFVDNMHRSIRPFIIKEMSIQTSDDSNLQGDFRMVTYYMPTKSLEIRKASISSDPATAAAGTPTTSGTVAPAGAVRQGGGTEPAATSDVPAGVDTTGVPQ